MNFLKIKKIAIVLLIFFIMKKQVLFYLKIITKMKILLKEKIWK